MRLLKAVVSRLTRSQMSELRTEVTRLQNEISQMSEVLYSLNHEIRAGSETALPLFLGWADRLRLDTETSIAAAQVIERQLSEMREIVERFDKS